MLLAGETFNRYHVTFSLPHRGNLQGESGA
mgnify:CR=1